MISSYVSQTLSSTQPNLNCHYVELASVICVQYLPYLGSAFDK